MSQHTWGFGLASLLVACTSPYDVTGPGHGHNNVSPDASSMSMVDAAVDPAVDGSVSVSIDAAVAPTECNGYEPCGIHPVVVPTGYTLLDGVSFDEYGVYGSCTTFDQCGMWNTHFTSNWNDGNTGLPVANYYSQMGSPFPWSGSRYEINVSPKRVQYAKLHIMSPGDMYTYTGGAVESETVRASGATTCYKRGASMESAQLENLGGTGLTGPVTWNISVLPGDMGNSGNASTCTGTGNTTGVFLTADPVKAATLDTQGHHYYCLLREGHDYYVNFMSSGQINPHFDCSTQVCSMGGWQLENFVGSDNSTAAQVAVACP